LAAKLDDLVIFAIAIHSDLDVRPVLLASYRGRRD